MSERGNNIAQGIISQAKWFCTLGFVLSLSGIALLKYGLFMGLPLVFMLFSMFFWAGEIELKKKKKAATLPEY